MKNEQKNFALIRYGNLKMLLLALAPFTFVIASVLIVCNYEWQGLTIFATLFTTYLGHALYLRVNYFMDGVDIVKNDWKDLREFLSLYYNNHIVGHDKFYAFDGGLMTESDNYLKVAPHHYVMKVPLSGWFRRPKLLSFGHPSKMWRLRVRATKDGLGIQKKVHYLVDRNGEKIALSPKMILLILKISCENFNVHSLETPTNCIEVTEYLESKVEWYRNAAEALKVEVDAVAKISFDTIDQLSATKSNFGRHQGGKAVRRFIGLELLRFFPADPRLKEYKDYAEVIDAVAN